MKASGDGNLPSRHWSHSEKKASNGDQRDERQMQKTHWLYKYAKDRTLMRKLTDGR